ncbi:MAG: GNAT family N-acetyltransferase [Patescibacteria group bacterium]
MKKFIPDSFQVPKKLETDRIRLRMLTIDDLTKDYEAVITSLEHLQCVFGPFDRWPQKDLTLEQDLNDLRFHQEEFQKRTSFTYTVMNLDETRCLGCVYIMPSTNVKYDVVVIAWVRKDELANGLDKYLFITVKNWIKEKWPFDSVAYPGRETSWDEFKDNYFLQSTA